MIVTNIMERIEGLMEQLKYATRLLKGKKRKKKPRELF